MDEPQGIIGHKVSTDKNLSYTAGGRNSEYRATDGQSLSVRRPGKGPPGLFGTLPTSSPPIETLIGLVEVWVIWHQISRLRRSSPTIDHSPIGPQGDVTRLGSPAVCGDRVSTPIAPPPVGTGVRLVRTRVSIAVREVTVPVASDLFVGRVPVETVAHPAEDGDLTAEVVHIFAGPVVVVATVIAGSVSAATAPLVLRDDVVSDRVRSYPGKNQPMAPLMRQPARNTPGTKGSG